MYAVVLSGNIITFLISWETMSVVSYFLVTFDRDKKSAKAGLLYAVMTHIGTAFIMALYFVLYKYTGTMEFSGMRAAAAAIPEDVKTLVFIFSIIGFGTKAGIIPFHIWLPSATLLRLPIFHPLFWRYDQDRHIRLHQDKHGCPRTGT